MSWENELTAAHLNIISDITKHFKLTVKLIARDIIKYTPRDTGQAQANWNIAINTIDDSVTYYNGRQVYADYGKLNIINAITPRSTCYQSNQLPYIVRLEDGWSKQRPVGWIKVIQANLSNYVEEAANHG